MRKLGTKNALFGYFWAKIFKTYEHTGNQHPQICLIAKFCEKTKMFQPRIKFVVSFWARILDFNFKLTQWKNFVKKTKMSKFGTKNTLFGYFLGGFLETIVIFEISTLQFV